MQPMAGYPQPQPRPTSGSNWVVMLAVVGGALVIFGGILAVLAISGVRRYLVEAKKAEALSSLGAISRAATSTYDDSALTGSHSLCASASTPVPASLADVSGKKYMSSPADWSKDAPSNAGFACLAFSMSSPQYYQYDYHRTGSATGNAPGDGFVALAHGDLDGDGVYSTFSLDGFVDPTGNRVVTTAGPPKTKNPDE